MEILQKQALQKLHTFGFDTIAAQLIEIHSTEQLTKLAPVQLPNFVLGGGSNVAFSKDFEGLILLNRIKGIQIAEENDQTVTLKVGAGENWHELVLWCVERGYGGIENLALIPGTVGAAPVQNIGAYGVELKDVFVRLEAVDLQSGAIQYFSKSDCAFGYRDSIFKKSAKNKYCITQVYLRLSKHPVLNISYGAIQKVLESKNITNYSIKEVFEAVVEIRNSKLPNPEKIKNAGSFFKNPVVDYDIFLKIQQKYPNMPFYEVGDQRIKIPAGWLIEQQGWKGYRKGDIGVYERHALVLVNYGSALGSDLYDLYMSITESVYNTFGIRLEPEVNIL